VSKGQCIHKGALLTRPRRGRRGKWGARPVAGWLEVRGVHDLRMLLSEIQVPDVGSRGELERKPCVGEAWLESGAPAEPHSPDVCPTNRANNS